MTDAETNKDCVSCNMWVWVLRYRLRHMNWPVCILTKQPYMLNAALSTRPATKKQMSSRISPHRVSISVVNLLATGLLDSPFGPASGLSLPESGILTEMPKFSEQLPKRTSSQKVVSNVDNAVRFNSTVARVMTSLKKWKYFFSRRLESYFEREEKKKKRVTPLIGMTCWVGPLLLGAKIVWAERD